MAVHDLPAYISDDTWIALSVRGDSERLSRMRDQLVAFQRIAMVLGSEVRIEEVLRIINDNTTQLMRCERSTLFLVEEDAVHRVRQLSSVIDDEHGVVRIPFGVGIAGTVALKQKTLNIKDVYKDPLFDRSSDPQGFRTTSCLAMPILNIQHELLGVIQVTNKHNGYFRDEDVEMLASICSQIAVSLTQHQFYLSILHKNAELIEAREKLERRNEELDLLYALEREAATALDLPELLHKTHAKCLQAFHVKHAAILILKTSDQTQNVWFSPGAQEATYAPQVLETIPAFLRPMLRTGECFRASCEENAGLLGATEALFGAPLGVLLVAPLSHQDGVRGALILGDATGGPERFTASDAKLAAIFASHLAPSIVAQLDRAQNEKQQRLFAIGQMIATLLHDMKTPLANISGYADLMVAQPSAEKRATFAGVIDRQVNMLTNMSTEILQFARGQSAVVLEHRPLQAAIDAALDQLQPEAQKRQIQLVCREKFGGSIAHDADKMTRILVNLVRNAFEAIEQNGEVEVRSYADAAHVYVAVRDDGPGIDPRIAQTLFEPFVTLGKRGGTGLGLAIVKKMVDEHRGAITWQPVDPHGAAFVMAFER